MRFVKRGGADLGIFIITYLAAWFLLGWWPWAMLVFAVFVGFNLGDVIGYKRGITDGVSLVHGARERAQDELAARRKAAPYN